MKPNGVLHIDEFDNKDVYRMLYFTPLDDLKKCRKLLLKVEIQKWSGMPTEMEASFIPEDYE